MATMTKHTCNDAESWDQQSESPAGEQYEGIAPTSWGDMIAQVWQAERETLLPILKAGALVLVAAFVWDVWPDTVREYSASAWEWANTNPAQAVWMGLAALAVLHLARLSSWVSSIADDAEFWRDQLDRDPRADEALEMLHEVRMSLGAMKDEATTIREDLERVVEGS